MPNAIPGRGGQRYGYAIFGNRDPDVARKGLGVFDFRQFRNNDLTTIVAGGKVHQFTVDSV